MDRRRMDVDAERAAPHHLAVEDVRQLPRERAIGAAREGAIEVAPVGQVARIATETQQVDNRDPDDHAVKFVRIKVVHDLPDHLYTVQFVTVNGGCQTHGGAIIGPVYHQHRGVDSHAAERARRLPYQPGGGCRGNFYAQQ